MFSSSSKMHNANNNNNNNASSSNNATSNSSNAPTSPPTTTSFGSPQGNPQQLPNGYYRMSDLNSAHYSHIPSNLYNPMQQHPLAMFPGPLPMHPVNIYAMNPMNSFMFHPTGHGHQHQRSSSYPTQPGAPPSFPAFPNNNNQGQGQGQDQTTVNPQLISSPILDAGQWMQQQQQQHNSFFPSPPQHAPIGIQSPYLGSSLPVSSHGQGYPPLFASPEANFDGLRSNAPRSSSNPHGKGASSESKKASDRSSNSNDPSSSLHPQASASGSSSHRDPSKRHSAPAPGPAVAPAPSRRGPPSDTSSFVLLTGPTGASTTVGPSSGATITGATRASASYKAPRAMPPRRGTAHKRRRLSDQDISDDDEDDEDDDEDGPGNGGRNGGLKLHKACSNCRKQKGKCVKKETEDKCRMCRTRNLVCQFEPRPERKQPVQRKLLLEQLRKKDAIIESFRQMLRPHMLQHHLAIGSEHGPETDHHHHHHGLGAGLGFGLGQGHASSGSPPSSAAHEEPLRRQVLEWLDKAEASRTSAVDFAATLGGVDGRAYNDSSSDEAGDAEGPEGTEGTEETGDGSAAQPPSLNLSTTTATTTTTSASRPGPIQRQTSSRVQEIQGKMRSARERRSKSPRITRGSGARNAGGLAGMHPVELLARASLRGSGALQQQQQQQQQVVNQSSSSAGDGNSYVMVPPGGSSAPAGGSASYNSFGGSPASQIDIGVARHDYFVSGDALEAQRASQLGLRRIEIDRGLSEEPKLLRKGLIVPDEVDKLFEIFYEKLNVTVSLLDPVLHTPATTFARCPLLFTVVCAVAARYYTERPELYSIAMHFAMTSAASSLMDSKKSVELCQAYLLLSVWPLPSRKYDEDRAWLYLGLAIRMAMDLNLHLPTNVDVVSEQQEREILNRTRTWIICFNMDRSSSTQLGKPMTIRENYMIRTSSDWYQRSKFNQPYDLHLCQQTALMRIMSRFQETVYADIESPSGVREDLDLRETAFAFDDEIMMWEKQAAKLFAAESDPKNPGSLYRCHLLSFYANYSRLVILSFGFQYSFRMGLLAPNDDLITRCLDAAQNVISKMINDLAARAYLRYAPDGHLVYASFASAFLLKLLRHKFVHLLPEEKRSRLIPLVERLIRALNDPSVAIDESHTPRIYARFLAGLLHKHRALSSMQQRMEKDHDKDTDMNMNTQERQVGFSIDLNMVHQHHNIAPGSPHPSIRVTPPPAGDHTFGYMLHNPQGLDHQEHGDTEMLGNGSDIRLDSGSGTVHPMDAITREEEDDDILTPFRAVTDVWQHGGIPWGDMNTPIGWEKDILDQSYLANLDG